MKKTVAEVLKSKPISNVYSVTPDSSVFAAMKLMAEKGIGALVVLEGERLAGIVSDLRVINGQRGKLALFKLDDKTATIEASADEGVLNAHRDILKDDEFVVISGRVQLDHFSGGLRVKVQQAWDLAGARAKYGRYLQVAVGDSVPDVNRLVREFPAKREETEHGDILVHGLRVRMGLCCKSEQGAAVAEIQLGEASRFFPSDAALAAWSAQAGSGSVSVVYDAG